MKDPHEIILSAADAAELAAFRRGRSGAAAALLADHVEEVLGHARVVAPEHLPADRVAIGRRVTYLEEPAGVRRKVTLCRPGDADASPDCLSVLSPSGLALLGRRPGSVVMWTLANGWPFTVRVLEAGPAREAYEASSERKASSSASMPNGLRSVASTPSSAATER